MSKFLLTGGSGTLGTELQKHLDCFAPSSGILNILNFSRDLMDIGGYDDIHMFEEQCHRDIEDVDTLIHCAAFTDVPGAEIEQRSAVVVNVEGTRNMATWAANIGWRFVYISTDYVYGGIRGNYTEEDKTEPFNFYGFTKLAGEAFVDLDEDLIIRTSFKPNDLWETKYDKAFVDLYTSADYVDVIAKDIALAVDSDLSGIVNIGTERKSIYELAASRYPGVGKMSIAEVSDKVRLPTDISMNIDRFLEFKRTRGGSQ